jgi:hypothetical protein
MPMEVYIPVVKVVMHHTLRQQETHEREKNDK